MTSRFGIVVLLLVLACSKPATTDATPASSESGHVDESEHPALPRRVHLSPDVIRDAKIEAIPVSMEILATTLGLAGEIVADPDRSAKVSSPVAGRLEEVRFKEGAEVKKGEALATLRVPDLGRVRGAYAATAAKAKAAHTNSDRLKSLLDQRLTSEQSYVDAKTDADALDAEATALAEQLGAMGAGSGAGFLLTLRAPTGGTIIARDAIVGQPVATDQILASIADLGEVWFLGRVFEKDLGRLAENAPGEVTLNAYPQDRFDGVLEHLGQQIDPVARTLTARVRLTNRAGMLRVGLFGVARIGLANCEKREPGLIVLRTAVIEVANKSVVFVEEPDGDYEMHDVVVGDSALGKVQIVTGLREGERVVVRGAFTLKSVVMKSNLAEEE
ncbi:efflux RND transporter periplasmic adaptor subunit [soil metagenome]